MRHLSIRDVPADLARALDAERRRRHASSNETVKQLLRQSLALDTPRRVNGLGDLAGGWSEAELAEFESATAVFETIDADAWK